jgi:hypothetical protein|tara:strand:+ start:264 stop:815 length:552 start_codon:yes stop_codon:yes gene_type:complete
MGTLFVDKLDPQSGTSLEIGSSGDTITIPSGATITNNGTQTGFGGNNTPSFFVKLSGNQSQSGSATKLQLNTEVWDSDGKYDTSNYRFTPTVAGKYVFMYGTNVGAMSDGYSLFLTPYKNGSSAKFGSLRYQTGSAGSGLYITGSTILESDTDDYFELYGHSTDGNHFDAEMTYFAGYKLIGV